MDLYSVLVGAAVALVLASTYYEVRHNRTLAKLEHIEHAVATEFVRLVAEDALIEQLEVLDSPFVQTYRARNHLRTVKEQQS